jgi:hypothetical protein
VYYRFPKRKSSALQGPRPVDRTAILPEDTVEIGFFPQGKQFPPSPAPAVRDGKAGVRNPAAIGSDKSAFFHAKNSGKGIQVGYAEKNKTRFKTAAV